MDAATWVQILDEAVFIEGQIKFFNLGKQPL